jgi:beta-carotene 15,15'-dioxygenase
VIADQNLAGSGSSASSNSAVAGHCRGALSPSAELDFLSLRAVAMPLITFGLVMLDHIGPGLGDMLPAMIAAVAIIVVGIPHGSLDIEIAATRFGKSTTHGKIQITSAYLAAAILMTLLWFTIPPLALTLFLIVSIIHFSADWRTSVDPFLAYMVGWALIALPALSHLDAVTAIFSWLTGNQSGAVIAALLACSAVPAVLGCIVYTGLAFRQGRHSDGIDLVCCLFAMVILPPLISFALFFCCLHSPRHLIGAVQDAGKIPLLQKAVIALTVIIFALGLGVLLFVLGGTASVDTNVIRTAFLLLSILTVPHFILEQLSDRMSTS